MQVAVTLDARRDAVLATISPLRLIVLKLLKNPAVDEVVLSTVPSPAADTAFLGLGAFVSPLLTLSQNLGRDRLTHRLSKLGNNVTLSEVVLPEGGTI
jgi:hypothetical protein